MNKVRVAVYMEIANLFLLRNFLKNEWLTTSRTVDYVVLKQASKQLAIRIFEEN